MRKFILAAMTAVLWSCASPETEVAAYKDPGRPVEERVGDLLARMTTREKVMQLTQFIVGDNDNANNLGHAPENISPELGSCIYFETSPRLRNTLQKRALEESRLGIPMIFGYDVIHGFRTIFPIGLAQACSWNPELVREAFSAMAHESFHAGVDWTFAPMIDIARDPRWGRVSEGFGEDPYAQGIYAAAAVRGLQGGDLAAEGTIAACLKHYVGYGAAQAGRDYTPSEISAQTLWDTYLPPFEAGVKAGAATVMSAFNDISGVPASSNRYTLTEILKERWGFDGFVVTDWDAVKQLLAQGAAADGMEAVAKAVNAGVDMDMNDNLFGEWLEKLVAEGDVPAKRLDDAVARILRIKFRLGLFERPYIDELPEDEYLLLPQARTTARRLAEESIVLLKNSNGILPLNRSSRVAVIGPMAKNSDDLMGSWSAHGRGEDVLSFHDALAGELSGLTFSYGCDLDGTDDSRFGNAISTARNADVVVLCVGESRHWTGENNCRSTIELPDIQQRLIAEVAGAGTPLVLVVASGRPIGLGNVEPHCDAIVEAWHGGTESAAALARILTGKVNPSGRLAVTFPYSSGQIPIFYNTRPSARSFMGFYQDIPSEPLYELGHGLSYTEYSYGEVGVEKQALRRDQTTTVWVDVTNTGSRDGLETVHWFVSDPACSITRPVKELKHFEKRLIPAGQTERFEFKIDPWRDLSYVDSDGHRFLESGEYRITVKNKSVSLMIID